MEYQPMARNLPSDPFLRSYLECAERCGLLPMEDGRETIEALELAVSPHWTDTALASAKADCDAFLAECGHIAEADLSRAGHDFWLSRNGYRAGFWAGDWKKDGAAFTKTADTFGTCYVYFDDGKEELTFE
jgi:hypothetical protein